MTTSLDDLLAGGGGRTAKFPTIGASITGRVVTAETRQQKSFDTGEPEFWSDGNPKLQIVVTLATDQRDPADPEDDGQRNVYLKGWGQQLNALRAAVAKAGAKNVAPGGVLTVTYIRDGEIKQRGFNALKEYDITYAAPSQAALGDLLGGGQQATAPAAPVAQPAPAAPAVDAAALQAALAALGPDAIAALQAARPA